MSPRITAVAALAVPVLAGIAYLWFYGAPASYPVINAVALAIGMAAILLPPLAIGSRARRTIIVVLLLLLFVPLATGPHLNGIARWLPLGPFQLHAGTLVLPSLAVLAARETDYAPPILLAALLAAFAQPDAATGFAVMFTAVGLYNATRDWRLVPVAGVAFLATLIAGFRGELPAQPFVERLLMRLALEAPLIALALLAALLAGFFMTAHSLSAPKAERHALAGALFGFSLAALLSNYPSVLIGYGAAPIIGFGAALALARQTPSG
ncbi:hypothetical protein P7228_11840 [Altererythrobacter arenosus]|uniref:FtsW/RodA/SpoVE family cell cycle protein n=1 Tax=Altererythrobacter arenosus TaxID=3032592 RepID=A0ABY8FRF5_9SPHN|nr:hypothetical protein [Altererythrobacter sp. CAU 1644]WFL76685.1 hypothetical protein P7228_11840 [Altererythrobacter sp. CAU 1644]